MADKKVSDLPALVTADATDVVPLVDISASVTKKVTVAGLAPAVAASVPAGTFPASVMDINANPETRMSESLGNFVASGLVWSATSGLAAAMTVGVVYIGGLRVPVSLISSRTFTASKDTYVSVNNAGTVAYSEVTNNAASPSLPANSVWLAIVVTNGSTVTSVNVGQVGAVAPVISSIAINVSTSLGDLICPKPGQKLIAYAQAVGDFTTASTTPVQITGLIVYAKVPAGRTVKLTAALPSAYNTATGTNKLSVYDGATHLGMASQTIPTGGYAANMTNIIHQTPVTTSKTYSAALSATAGTAGTIFVSPSINSLSVELE
ncbi:hypothetical protein NG701_07430 [Pseudarthrobacter sp. HLT3-5]|uniref:hypothetical protein n=1 Tax=Pseudarthrobacter cellobiosi TaxID=2953654 RepID=UPI00208F93AE|nr:hypothetical protein [Pseudarthrobacter sp. HLT3-5]MCO4274259.1 hypothetical protein [Pseudarthrobacter sp. HLT3-5]